MKARYILILLAMLAVVGCKEEEKEKEAKGMIHGLITDLETGELIENARVILNTGLSVVTDQTGAYQFDNLSVGTYTVTAKKVGYPDSTLSEPVHLRPGLKLQVDLQLDKRTGGFQLRTAEGGQLSQLDFSEEGGNDTRSFSIVNLSRKHKVDWSIEHSVPWIESVTPAKGTLDPEAQESILVKINRNNLDTVVVHGLMHVLSKKGNQEVKVIAKGFEKPPQGGWLRMYAADGSALTQLDFGGEQSDITRSFTLVNESKKRVVDWECRFSVPWIANVSPYKGSLAPKEQISVLVKIDREKVEAGVANGLLHVLSGQGNQELKVMAIGRLKTPPSVKVLGCEAISDESAFATLKVEKWGSQLIKSFGMQVIYPNETEWRNVSATLSTHVKTYFATIPTGASAPLGSVLRVRPYAADADGNVLWSGEEMNVPIEKHAPVVKLTAGDNGAQGKYSVVWRMEQLGYPAAERIVVNVSDTREKAYTGVADISWTAISQVLKYGYMGDTLELKPSGGEVLKSDATHYIFFQLEGAELGSVRSDVLEHHRLHPDWHCIGSIRLMVQRKDLGSARWDVAKSMCEGSSLGGFDNWRLPTKEELAAIYGEKEAIGGFEENGYYWTSEVRKGYNEPYGAIAFSEGYFLYRVEAARSYVRAVRSY